MTDLSSSVAAPALFALLCWWFGTGAILWLVRRPADLSAQPGAVHSAAGAQPVDHAAEHAGADGGHAYLGFASVIVMWAWHELAFLTGWLTGPRRVPLSRAHAAGSGLPVHPGGDLARTGLAVQLLRCCWMQQGQPSHVALCTFAVLWCMRFSAKLNLFFGVPEVGEQYLPRHLAYLGSYFRKRAGSARSSISAWRWPARSGPGSWEVSAVRPSPPAGSCWPACWDWPFVEHLIMAFPTPMQKLWGWAMSRSPSSDRLARVAAACPPRPVAIQPDKAPVA
jgi:putative photosynthetic complex assembly protein 2